jgi:hypothetical protein
MVSLRRSKARAGTGGAPAKPRRPRGARLKQMRQAFTLTRQADPRMPLYVVAALLAPFLLLLAIGLVVDAPFLLGVLGLTVGLLAATFVFGQRVQRTAYSQVEGQVGAAAAVLSNMRGDWRVTPAVGFTREQDLVHRVVGRPGIVLVAEGAPNRTRSLVANEKKRLARFVGDTPVYDVQVGEGDGQVPLRGLERHFAKLPRNITGKDVNVLDRKLKAMAPALPVPKGPVPTRVPRGRVR